MTGNVLVWNPLWKAFTQIHDANLVKSRIF